jgi:hypothetical protein
LRGACDVQFWLANAAPTRPAFDWYLQRVATAVQEMLTTKSTTSSSDSSRSSSSDSTSDNSDENTKIVLICHSAGGWLARACLGFYGEKDDDTEGDNTIPETAATSSVRSSNYIPLDRILGIVTLGAPHVPPPPPNVMDMTRGALRITHETFPGAYHSKSNKKSKRNENGSVDGKKSGNDNNRDDNHDIFYITVAGNAVRGKKQERTSPFEPTTVTGFAYNSYNAVLGDGTALGDGVVPVRKKKTPTRNAIQYSFYYDVRFRGASNDKYPPFLHFLTMHWTRFLCNIFGTNRWMQLTWTMRFRLIWMAFFIPLMHRINGMAVTLCLIPGTTRCSRRLLHVHQNNSNRQEGRK